VKKPRQPTAADYKALRRLYDAAGGRDALDGWIEAALREGKQRRGPKQKKEGGLPLHLLEYACDMLVRLKF
jgi:hypothetical protein